MIARFKRNFSFRRAFYQNFNMGLMELRVLKYFTVVAAEGSITKAAERLFITQPTLSRQIAELEEEVGSPLLVRTNRSVSLTAAGELLLRRAEEMIALEEKIIDELGTSPPGGTVSLGLAESYSANAVADVMSVFRSKYPDVRFDLFTATADLVLERIDKGLVDIGFLLEPVDVEKYDFVRLEQTERIGILTRADSHLASRGMVTADELVSEPLIVPVRRELRQNFRNIIGTVYDRFNIVATFNVINNASLLVLRGVGSVLVIEGAAQYQHDPLLRFVPIAGHPPMGCVAVWKKFQPSGRAVSLFWEELAMLRGH